MKRFTKIALLATAIAAIYTQAAVAAPYNPGDLLIGFRVSTGSGSDTTYTVNVGAATTFRDATSNIAVVTNIGADLATAFGAGWASNANLFWGIAGNNTNAPSGAAVNGDPVRTIYASQDQTTLGTQSSAAFITSSTTRGTVATNITTYGNNFATRTVAANPNGAIVPTSASNDYADFQTGSTSFTSTFGYNGIEGSNAAGIDNTALDLYRILNSTAGADPAGLQGTGSYEGTFTIDALGNIAFRLTAAEEAPVVPEPVSTGILLSCAFGAMVALRRREKTLIEA